MKLLYDMCFDESRLKTAAGRNFPAAGLTDINNRTDLKAGLIDETDETDETDEAAGDGCDGIVRA